MMLDARHALRTLGRDPAFTIIVVLTLALGIGANTAMFSVINATLLDPLNFGSPDRIVRLVPQHPQFGESDLTFALADLADLRSQAATLVDVAAYDGWLTTLDTPDGAERIEGAIVSDNYFRVLGIRPALGRFFLPEEGAAGGEPVLVLSYGLWRDRFGGDADLPGHSVRLNGVDHTVVGVAPPDLDDPQLGRGTESTPEFWRPPPRSWTQGERSERGYRSVTAIARLEPGAALERAQAEVATIFRQLELSHPAANADWSARVVPLQDFIVAPVRTPLLVLLTASLLVLLIACANVAHLMLARTARRSREFAVRRALGAAPRRIAAQSLLESLLLALAGGAAGVLIAWQVTDLIVDLGAGQVPRLVGTSVDERTLLFTAALSIVTGVIFGMAPALRASRLSVQSVLKEGGARADGGRRQRRFRGVLVATEAATAVVLLAGTGLLIRSLWGLYAVDPGLDARDVLTSRLEISWNHYDTDARVVEVFDQIVGAVTALPGVESAGLVNVLPFSGGYWRMDFTREGPPARDSRGDTPSAEVRTASPAFFRAMRIAVAEGRSFDERDVMGATPVAVVNRALAERYFPDRTPVGARIEFGDEVREVVGVTADVHEFDLERDPVPVLYLPHAQAPSWLTRYSYLVVRTAGDALAFAPGVRETIRAIDRGIPVSDMRTMERVVAHTTAPHRFRTVLLALLGGLAVALAALGIYGVVSYSLAQRTREIGVRLALGAQVQEIFALLVLQEMRPVLVGAGLGVLGAIAGGHLLAALLFGITPTDLPTLIAAPLLLALVALAATLIPSRRAARSDPATTLRVD